jgi:hypothetical protein
MSPAVLWRGLFLDKGSMATKVVMLPLFLVADWCSANRVGNMQTGSAVFRGGRLAR